jgi:hypothetical protein
MFPTKSRLWLFSQMDFQPLVDRFHRLPDTAHITRWALWRLPHPTPSSFLPSAHAAWPPSATPTTPVSHVLPRLFVLSGHKADSDYFRFVHSDAMK